jgi:hypothetical protein
MNMNEKKQERSSERCLPNRKDEVPAFESPSHPMLLNLLILLVFSPVTQVVAVTPASHLSNVVDVVAGTRIADTSTGLDELSSRGHELTGMSWETEKLDAEPATLLLSETVIVGAANEVDLGRELPGGHPRGLAWPTCWPASGERPLCREVLAKQFCRRN